MKHTNHHVRHLTTTRLWILVCGVVVLTAVVAALLLIPSQEPVDAGVAVVATQAARRSETPTTSSAAPTISDTPSSDKGPHTLDHRSLAESTATALYTWDTRTSAYTDVYARVRGWWMVLDDGSNPLSLYTAQFEGTGIDAAAFAHLTSRKAYRTSRVVETKCDSELTKYVEHPAPWQGLHVCTVTVSVTDRSTSDTGSTPYTVPVSVVANCPPAESAPGDRCALVAFYTDSARIVY